MKATTIQFKDKILSLKPTAAPSNSEYGSKVMPVLQFYKGLESFEERRSFQDAIELLLKSDIEAERIFAVDICLGFFVFRDAI